MKIKKILLGLCLCSVMAGCQQKDDAKQTDVTTITNINNIQFQIPSSLREGVQTYNDFMASKVKVTNDFDYGVVETATTHIYKLTDYSSYYVYCTDDFPFTTNLAYINNANTMQAELKNSFEDMVLSNFQYAHENGVTQILADIQFTPLFQDETNVRRIENARGKIILYGIADKQFLFVYADNNGIVPEEDYNNIFQSFTYTQNESSLYENKNRIVKTYETKDCGINIYYNEMSIEQDNQLVIPLYNNATITTTILKSDSDREMTDDEIIAYISQEEVKSRTILWKDVATAKDTNKIWQGRTYRIVDVNNHQYTESTYSTNLGKTIIIITATYNDNNDPQFRDDMNHYLKDLVQHSETTHYLGLNGKVVKLIQEATTEATTEVTTQTTTQAMTEVTTQAITEATTETTTQAPTQATTQVNKNPQQSTTEKTTEKKPNKKKEKNDSELDVEW